MILSKFYYCSRIFQVYILRRPSHLNFWHENPQINEGADFDGTTLGQYYMSFADKAAYMGPFDGDGVPLLDYHGKIGKQYNPIAVAQYGLAHYNLCKKIGEKKSFDIFLKQADWLVDNLEQNQRGLKVWMHHFDFEYKKVLKAPWYSALAQGQGISLLCRAYLETKNEKYILAAKAAFQPLLREIKDGGVQFKDDTGNIWLEEYIVDPPTHILNGFIWALWGVYDFWLATADADAKNLFDACVATLRGNISKYDIGFWSLYDLSRQRIPNIASPFYHNLHIVQLNIMHKLTGERIFQDFAARWADYKNNFLNKNIALFLKAIFKIFYW